MSGNTVDILPSWGHERLKYSKGVRLDCFIKKGGQIQRNLRCKVEDYQKDLFKENKISQQW